VNFRVEIAPHGITALEIKGLRLTPKFQAGLSGGAAWAKDFAQLDLGGARAMVLNFGPGLQSAYVYLEASGAQFKEATLRYSTGGEWKSMTDAAFPFEFTVPLPPDAAEFNFKVEAVRPSGEKVESEIGKLAR
jgi:hypothetical protein